MLNLDRWSGWFTVAANLGVVVGLVLVAAELDQNTQIARAQAITSSLTGTAGTEIAIMGDSAALAYVAAMDHPESVTRAEIVQVWGYLNAAVLAIENTHSMYRLGLSTKDDWESVKQGVNGWLGFPFGRIWWELLSCT